MGWFRHARPAEPDRDGARLDQHQRVHRGGECVFEQRQSGHAARAVSTTIRPARYSWTDPTTNQAYNIPTFTATQSLSPARTGNPGAERIVAIQSRQHGGEPERRAAQFAGHSVQSHAGQRRQSRTGIRMRICGPILMLPQYASSNGWRSCSIMRYSITSNMVKDEGAAGFSMRSRPQRLRHAATWIGCMPFPMPRAALPMSAGSSAVSVPTPISRPHSASRRHHTIYGPGDFSRSHVEESLYQRMDPQLQRDRQALEARLADQGIQVGSMAHQQAMDQFNRQLTDTRLGITQTAGRNSSA